MKLNMGTTDRVIRLIIAAIIAALYFTNIITGIFATILLVIAIVFVLTSLAGFCPLYAMLGINSCPTKEKKIH